MRIRQRTHRNNTVISSGGFLYTSFSSKKNKKPVNKTVVERERKKAIIAAQDFEYGESVIRLLEQATTTSEISRIMERYRRSLMK